jgi:hypothetical protein
VAGRKLDRAARHRLTAPGGIQIAGKKSAGIAAVLSFVIAGVGEVYAGQVLRGIPFLVADLYLSWLAYKDFSPTTMQFNTTALTISFFVSVASAVDAAYCAIQHNKKNLAKCPRCGATNVKGNPACLMCGTPLPGAVAPAPPFGSPPPL